MVALRQDQAKLEREKTLLWGKLITWCLEVKLDETAAALHYPIVVVQVARGMQRLEALGIIHRDLAAR